MSGALASLPSVPGSLPGSVVPVLLAVLGVAGVVGYLVLQHRRKRAKEASLVRLLRRSPGWYPTNQPCGLAADVMADRTACTPRGDRRYGIRYGIAGPLRLPIPGTTQDVEAAFFQWFSEERSTNRSTNGATTTSYRERREVVGMARLPLDCPTHVRIDAESLLGRIGLTRGGDQLESSEFNRRFRVDGGDRALTVQLLDANLQSVLLEDYRDRTVDLERDLLVLGGSPTRRDDSLTGVIGDYPAVREDLVRLVGEFPPQFWRAIGAQRGPDVDGLVIAALIVLVPLAWLVVSYNRFVTQGASIDASWANIDAQLQRRHDLIPNLVETVRGYAAHEQRAFQAVTDARARAVAAVPSAIPVEQQARAEDALTQGLTSLLAVSEAYPDLKADGTFRDLQRQLVETEDRISAARRLYNLEVAAYERRRRSVPSNVVAGAFSFDERRLFEIQDAAAEHAVQVDL